MQIKIIDRMAIAIQTYKSTGKKSLAFSEFFTTASSYSRFGGSSVRYGGGYADNNVELYQNSAVAACLSWMYKNALKAPLGLHRESQNGNKREERFHPATKFFKKPNKFQDFNLFVRGLIHDYAVDGNYYIWKRKSLNGTPEELVWLPERKVTPVKRTIRSEGYDYYRYNFGGSYISIPKEDIIHRRNGVDPNNPDLGYSPLKAAAREVATDEYTARYSSALMGNQAKPSVLISGKGNNTLTPEEAEDVKEAFERDSGGENIGRVSVLGKEVQINEFNIRPKDLELGSLRHVPEERICAVFGIPLQVIGFGAGLKATTYDNMTTAERRAYEECLIPFWKDLAEALNEDLLPDFGEDPLYGTLKFGFDWSEISALQEDLTSKQKRADQAIKSGGITINEYRAELNMTAIAGGDVLYIPRNCVAVPLAELANYKIADQLKINEPKQLDDGSVDGEIVEE